MLYNKSLINFANPELTTSLLSFISAILVIALTKTSCLTADSYFAFKISLFSRFSSSSIDDLKSKYSAYASSKRFGSVNIAVL